MISIVVPIYNGEKYIDDCIRSILVQTYTEWELVLIDNASTDDSLRICKDYACKDDRIQTFHQHHNMGVSVARNLGIEKARGEFITFIDIDDWIEEDYLERLIALQKRKNAGMVICEYHRFYSSDREAFRTQIQNRKNGANGEGSKNAIEKSSDNGKCRIKEYQVKEYLEKYLLKGNTHCWGVLFQRELLYGIYFPKGMTIGEDMLFLLEVAQKAETIVVTDYKGYHYYINNSGAMNKKFTKSYMDQITCWEKALQKMNELYPELITRVESIIVVSILLVVGKISELDSEERKKYIEEENRCYDLFMVYGKKKEIRKFLPSGYPLKVLIYRFFPKAYVFLYGKLK